MSFFVAFIHGPAASGKHTIGSLVSEKLGVPLFHNHLTVDLVRTLFDFGTEPFIQLRADIWRHAFQAASRAGRSFVFTFNPERTVDPALLTELHGIVEEARGQVHYVELRCSDEALEERLGNASRQAFGKLTDVDLFRALRQEGGFEFPPLPKALICIDTERTVPVQAADEIAAALGSVVSG